MNGSRHKHGAATRLLTAGGLGLIVVMGLGLPGLVIPLLIALAVWGFICWRSERERVPLSRGGLVRSRVIDVALRSKPQPPTDPADSLHAQLRQTPEGRLRLLRAANLEAAARGSAAEK